MEEEITKAEFIIIVCTKQYLDNVKGNAAPAVGLGSAYEWSIMERKIYKDRGNAYKVVPVYYGADDVIYIPELAWDCSKYDVATEAGFEALVRGLLKLPEIEANIVGRKANLVASLATAQVLSNGIIQSYDYKIDTSNTVNVAAATDIRGQEESTAFSSSDFYNYSEHITYTSIVLIFSSALLSASLSHSWLELSALQTGFMSVCATMAALLLSISWKAYTSDRLAVLLFVLDEKKRLLLIEHPKHKRLLPPGGRIPFLQMPHDWVKQVLYRETGITPDKFVFDKIFHPDEPPFTDSVDVVPAPYRVQREHRTQRGGVRRHYAFIYVLRTSEYSISSYLHSYNPSWYTIDDYNKLKPPRRPFDDIEKRYMDILNKLNQSKRS